MFEVPGIRNGSVYYIEFDSQLINRQKCQFLSSKEVMSWDALPLFDNKKSIVSGKSVNIKGTRLMIDTSVLHLLLLFHFFYVSSFFQYQHSTN